jgi:DNA-directed RNA polymerase specialized sigma24 family protein
MQRELVERAQAGELDAFTQLVKAFAPRLHGIANLILHDSELAQDAVQGALLMGWPALDGGAAGRHRGPWVPCADRKERSL